MMRHLVDVHHLHVAGLAQPVLQDCGPDRVLVDDDDFEGWVHRHLGEFKQRANRREMSIYSAGSDA
jgi:hypothetical protein